MRNGVALGGGPHHFFDRSSRSAEASSIWSASSFFSFAFSTSRAFRRFASDTSIPPYFAFQLYSVASETPCLRARSPAFAPASCSRRTAMICSSVNRFRFISPSFDQGPDSNLRWRKNSVAGQARSCSLRQRRGVLEARRREPRRQLSTFPSTDLEWSCQPLGQQAGSQIGLARIAETDGIYECEIGIETLVPFRSFRHGFEERLDGLAHLPTTRIRPDADEAAGAVQGFSKNRRSKCRRQPPLHGTRLRRKNIL